MEYTIDIVKTGINIYGIMIVLSLIIPFTLIYILLVRAGLGKLYALMAVFLDFLLCIYFAKMYTIITQYEPGMNIIKAGISSMGGVLGVLLGMLITGLIHKKYKSDVVKAHVTVIPLMYAIGKLGCHFAGCCYGRKSHILLTVDYGHGARIPVQLYESIVFFAICYMALRLYKYNRVRLIVIICAIAKLLLDFLREPVSAGVISTNQIVCIIVMAVTLVCGIVKKNTSKM